MLVPASHDVCLDSPHLGSSRPVPPCLSCPNSLPTCWACQPRHRAPRKKPDPPCGVGRWAGTSTHLRAHLCALLSSSSPIQTRVAPSLPPPCSPLPTDIDLPNHSHICPASSWGSSWPFFPGLSLSMVGRKTEMETEREKSPPSPPFPSSLSPSTRGLDGRVPPSSALFSTASPSPYRSHLSRNTSLSPIRSSY